MGQASTGGRFRGGREGGEGQRAKRAGPGACGAGEDEHRGECANVEGGEPIRIRRPRDVRPTPQSGPVNDERPRLRGLSEERLKGLEPSTFCMASSAISVTWRASCLQIGRFWALTRRRASPRCVALCRGSVHQMSTVGATVRHAHAEATPARDAGPRPLASVGYVATKSRCRSVWTARPWRWGRLSAIASSSRAASQGAR
jgi:hypothetical protein